MVKHLLTVWFIDVYGGFLSPTRYTGMISLNRPFLPPSLEDSVADTAVGWWIVWRLCCIMYSYIMLYYVILCYTRLYYVILCYTMLYYVILYTTQSYLGFSYSVNGNLQNLKSQLRVAVPLTSAYREGQGEPRRAEEPFLCFLMWESHQIGQEFLHERLKRRRLSSDELQMDLERRGKQRFHWLGAVVVHESTCFHDN